MGMHADSVNKTSSLQERLGRNWIAIFIVLLVVLFSVSARAFFSVDTAQLIFFNGTEVFLLAIAELFVIITGGIDLSVGFVMGFSTVVSRSSFVSLREWGSRRSPAFWRAAL
jgi:ribose transport system permease protein